MKNEILDSAVIQPSQSCLGCYGEVGSRRMTAAEALL